MYIITAVLHDALFHSFSDMSLSFTESFLCYIEACEREKRKLVVLFLLEYPPSENLCEERGDMPKQALKLFIAECYIMYCLT